MTRDEIIRMARECDIIDFRDESDDPHVKQMVDFLESFANLIERKILQNCKIKAPTRTMDQEFAAYHRRGFLAGTAAEREECAKVCEGMKWQAASDVTAMAEQYAARECAEAIRARGK